MIDRLKYAWLRLRGRYDLSTYTGFLRCKYGYRYNYLDINEDFDICEYHYRKERGIDSRRLCDYEKKMVHSLKPTLYTHIGLRGTDIEETRARLDSTSERNPKVSRAALLMETARLAKAFREMDENGEG